MTSVTANPAGTAAVGVGVAAGDEALGSGVALAVGEAVGGALEVATDGDGVGPGSG